MVTVMVVSWCAYVLVTSVLLVSSTAKDLPRLRCHHRRCRYLEKENDPYLNYDVEGNKLVVYNYKWSQRHLRLDCKEASLLDSPALPSFNPALDAVIVELLSCPLPNNSSLADTLAALNVTLCEREERCELQLYSMPPNQVFTAKHFVGLERLQRFDITNLQLTKAGAESNFLAPLKNLRKLLLASISFPSLSAEVAALAPSLHELSLYHTRIERVPEEVHSSASLRKLSIVDSKAFDAGAVPPGVRDIHMQSPASSLRMDTVPALESIWMEGWVETIPPPQARCDALRSISLIKPKLRALSEKWLWNCSHLESLFIRDAANLLTLPQQLFSPEGRLNNLVITDSSLQTLQEGVFDDLRSLEVLKLSRNRIKTLPRNLFKSFIEYVLSQVNLSYNDLDGDVLSVLESLPQDKLTSLHLSHNPRIGDFCDANGYSSIRWFIHLKVLGLRETGATRICTDWREELLDLELLDLSRSNITELLVKDIQFTRTVQAEVSLSMLNQPVAMRVTREDFNTAALAPPSFATVNIHTELNCDCNMYWARRVLEHPLARLSLPGFRELSCTDGGLLRDVPPEDLECTAQEECEVASLQDGCLCASRPDDDPTRDHWLVRVRCENATLGCVPRRMYPFYPIDNTNNQGAYVTHTIPSLD